MSESLIIPTQCDKTTVRQRAKAIARRLNTVFSKIDYDSRPYSLKNFFATALLNSGLEQNLQTFYMGHTGPVQNTYSVQRQLPPAQIEEMRKKFKDKVEPYLIPQQTNVDTVLNQKFKKLAEEFGMKISDDADTDMTIAQIGEVYRAAKDDLRSRVDSAGQQKVIDESELEYHLNEGWKFMNTLPSGKIIISNA